MKVLIIRGGALGDTLMLLPALSALPLGMNLTVVGREPGIGFIEPHVHQCMDLEHGGWYRMFQNSIQGVELPVQRADRVIAFFTDEHGEVTRNLKALFPHSHVHTFPSFPRKGSPIHVARYVAQCLKQGGLPLDEEQAMVNSLSRPLIAIEAPNSVRDRVVFHPGSGDVKKNHPPWFWHRLMDKFREQAGEGTYRMFALLGPAEERDREMFESFFATGEDQLVYCPSVDRLSTVLNESVLFIGHDSGISHLAAMLGRPTIALFRVSDPIQWRPLGPSVRVIRGSASDDGLLHTVVRTAASFLR
jgi:ADP-heptose:LPS heptosyltransferase